jgi:hypothetical protein
MLRSPSASRRRVSKKDRAKRLAIGQVALDTNVSVPACLTPERAAPTIGELPIPGTGLLAERIAPTANCGARSNPTFRAWMYTEAIRDAVCG